MKIPRDVMRAFRRVIDRGIGTRWTWKPAGVGRCERCARSRGRASILELRRGSRVEHEADPHGRVARARIYSTARVCLPHAAAIEKGTAAP